MPVSRRCKTWTFPHTARFADRPEADWFCIIWDPIRTSRISFVAKALSQPPRRFAWQRRFYPLDPGQRAVREESLSRRKKTSLCKTTKGGELTVDDIHGLLFPLDNGLQWVRELWVLSDGNKGGSRAAPRQTRLSGWGEIYGGEALAGSRNHTWIQASVRPTPQQYCRRCLPLILPLPSLASQIRFCSWVKATGEPKNKPKKKITFACLASVWFSIFRTASEGNRCNRKDAAFCFLVRAHPDFQQEPTEWCDFSD